MNLFTHSALQAYALPLFTDTLAAVANSAPDDDLTHYLDGLRALLVRAFVRACCIPGESLAVDDGQDVHLALLLWHSLSDLPCPYALQDMLAQARLTLALQQQASLDQVITACDRLRHSTLPLSARDGEIWQLFYQQLFNYNEEIA
ncbi:hypothetical protein [Pseudoalteromonas rubra]|uniref:Uncharacterized protein n=1 Tax=Pseudoalteromonas rubra TaxID=43658 RepID=A0A0U3H4A4_9GAMM|nr:hypothetical protein [Pseudoalteromonas rubra]ALU46115.1 hypothetical protein AT705_24445 [Pseudoalteromonas rubra]